MTVGLIMIGFAAGVLAGMLGIGGGAVFVPALVLVVGLSQVDAEATSLLAIVPVALVGAARQRAYGNVRMREGILLGLWGIPGAVAGVVAVNAAPERAVELAFACFLLYVATQLVRSSGKAAAQRPDVTARDGDL